MGDASLLKALVFTRPGSTDLSGLFQIRAQSHAIVLPETLVSKAAMRAWRGRHFEP